MRADSDLAPPQREGARVIESLPDGPSLPSVFQMLRFLPRPFEFLDRCHKQFGDAFTMRLPGYGNIVMLCSPALVKQLFTARAGETLAGKANQFLVPALGEHSLLTSDGAGHDRHRKLLLPAFHGDRMHVYGDVMVEETHAALDRMPVGQAFALRPFMRDIALNVILRAVFGLAPGAERDRIATMLVDFLAVPNPILTFIPHAYLDWPGSPLRAFMRRKARVDETLHTIIQSRRGASADASDILALLLQARDEAGAPMTEVELRDELLTMLAAGHATTAASLCWALERLTATPEAMEKLTAELAPAAGDVKALNALPYLDACVRETLRLRPIFTDVLREVTAPFEIAGHRVPTGTRLSACIYLVHRREDLYPDSAAFRPDRFVGAKPDPFAWLPFGGGARRCVGMGFALYQMKIVLGTLLTRGRFTSAEPRDARVERDGITLAPKGGGRVVLSRTEPNG